eukprot:5101532-Amphidinium_carterae.1
MPAQPKAMPSQPKAKPHHAPAEASSSSHEAPSVPELDQVLEMEAEDIPADIDDNDEVYHLGMLGGDGELIDESSPVMED